MTGLYGDGGIGKTLLAHQLATACAMGKPWLGIETMPCRAIMLACEDSADELHRRQAAINTLYDVEMCDLERLRLFSRVADENMLSVFDAAGIGRPTPLYHELLRECREFGAQLLIVDTAADTFGGNENIRGQVRQFIAFLTRIAIAIDGAVVLTAHPSVAGMASGAGYGGSTAWNASVRSRLYLSAPAADDKEPVDHEERVLHRKKANYARSGDEIRLRWREGVLRHVDAPTGIMAHIAGQAAERTFLDLLDVLAAQGHTVTDSANSPNRYAPRVMSELPSTTRSGLGEHELAQAMGRLFAGGAIRLAPEGPPSRNKTKIVRVGGDETTVE